VPDLRSLLSTGLSTGPDEWEGEPHTLIVHSVRLPDGPFDDGDLEYDLEHPPSCKQEERVYIDGLTGEPFWTCDVAQNEGDCGLPFSLRYSGTPVTEPGTYRIRAWGNRYYDSYYGAYEYDGGVAVIGEAPGRHGHCLTCHPEMDVHPLAINGHDYHRRQMARQKRKRR
jgi:hypothetical protein